MDLLLKEIGQMAIFLICAQTLLYFRAKDSYEKYIKLLISMMLLLLLTEPLIKLFQTENKTEIWNGLAEYGQVMEEVMGQGLIEEAEIEEILERITREKVEEGVGYIQENNTSVESEAGQKAGDEQILIEKIEVGGNHGEL